MNPSKAEKPTHTASSQKAGLSAADLDRETARFGVSDEQVRRDHAISHVLAAISQHKPDDVIFFGGTALSRTHLVHARLSEDIDLISLASRSVLAEDLRRIIGKQLQRSHGRVSWNPGFARQDDVAPAVLEIPEGISIKIQLLDNLGYAQWPVEKRQIEQRYGDVAPAQLIVPTISSFAAWKTEAWSARHAARDLYDLWALAERGGISAEAASLFAKHGPTGRPPAAFMFAEAPKPIEWEAALAGQTRLEIGADQALSVVRRAWASVLHQDWD